MRWAIIDTSVYIDYWERGLHDAALADVRKTFIIRQSSVVLSELRRGARTKAAQHLLQTLFGLARIQWAPTEADWWRAGVISSSSDASSGFPSWPFERANSASCSKSPIDF